ncbi:MAG: hypothetical protein ACFFDQ_06875 [Candidatus Thorarchaeota archaeon]
MKKTNYLVLPLLFSILVFSVCDIEQVAATVVWEDNFDDGNYSGWTVKTGDWDATDHYLEAIQTDFLMECVIWRNCSQVVGTWSFDVRLGTTSEGWSTTVLFFANGTERGDFNGYGLRVAGTHVYLIKQIGSFDPVLVLGSVETDGLVDRWTHFDVTRNSTGGFNVFINATSSIAEPDITAVDTVYSNSERFVIQANPDAQGIFFDNIYIDSEILIVEPEPTTPTTPTATAPPPDMTTMLLIVGGGVAVIVVLAIIVGKMRSS